MGGKKEVTFVAILSFNRWDISCFINVKKVMVSSNMVDQIFDGIKHVSTIRAEKSSWLD